MNARSDPVTGPPSGPLTGIRILELSQIVSGPLAVQLLAEQGAEVTKVEPVAGDLLRIRQPEVIPPLHANNTRGKRSIAIDMSHPAGLGIVLDLAEGIDVFVENFRPGVCERIGLGEAAVRERSPDVIYVSISGFGPDGPYADRAVLDPVIQGITGMVDGQRSEALPFPDLVRTLVADKTTAYTAAQAITAALYARVQGAGGQHLEIPMLDATLSWFWVDGMTDRTYPDDPVTWARRATDWYQLTPTADGQIVYYLTTTSQLHGMYRAIERDDLIDDERYSEISVIRDPEAAAVIGAAIAAGVAALPTAVVVERLAEGSVPAGPVLDRPQVEEDAQVVHNDVIAEWHHPVMGRIRQPRPPVRFSTTPTTMRQQIDTLGQSTDALLRELGHDDDAIAALRAAGTVL